jgi:hypothetical protein
MTWQMPLAVIGPRLFAPSHSCGRHAWACLGVPGADAEVLVEAAGCVMADLDDADPAALAADGDLPLITDISTSCRQVCSTQVTTADGPPRIASG